MQGMAWALGTAWAIRIMVLFVPHVGVSVIGSSAGATIDTTLMAAITAKAAIAAANTTRRGPQRCSEIGARAGPSSGTRRPGRARPASSPSAAASGWRRRVRRRTPRRSRPGVKYVSARSVDALGVGAHGEDEHHVGEVDRLPPRRRPHLRERDVDQHELAVADEQVGRLDVAVGEAGVPELAGRAPGPRR